MSSPQDQAILLSRPYPSAIAFATFSLLVSILIIPPLIQHYRNRNIGATVVVTGVTIANFLNFLNAVLWPNDDFENWFSGVGLCDVEVKFYILIQTLFPAGLACILRALAKVMDTNNTGWMRTTAQRRRAYAIDLICCVFLPSLQMPFHYIVQPQRYYLYGISGCIPPSDSSWLAVLLLLVPPLIWVIIGAFYAVLIVVRLLKYRLTLNTLLANSNTNKSRFFRLYLICCICVVGLIPTEVYVLLHNRITNLLPYSWKETHHPTEYSWDSAILVATHGKIVYDRIIWLVGGILIFAFFAFGRDAFKMYREGLLAIGMGRLFPSLMEDNHSHQSDSQQRGSITGTINSFSSKAKLFFKRKGSSGTFTDSMASTSDTTSPSKVTFMESIRENQPMQQNSGPFAGIASIFKRSKTTPTDQDPFILTNITGTFLSSVSAEPVSPTTASHIRSKSVGGHDVLVKKEVRQASETAETLPSKMYEGV
ncbi:hypothetical protein M409DRAFT_26194 [Zasmidium cellare ATCC 36951]|uniref:Uncharacterized protein n=1 Tax=Zasmidium cellare ATCC 36951 TaxID=1080233 RepID=A0A6A6C980_ZASCE|nr:uncharacterized protein M409DRAFT_26194 [Zasmidium cellare ATCC 36951]KAF2163585.1 hypothetical protein M409DRAFT_26194 [Zasmidium cellare ATCC 36951]